MLLSCRDPDAAFVLLDAVEVEGLEFESVDGDVVRPMYDVSLSVGVRVLDGARLGVVRVDGESEFKRRAHESGGAVGVVKETASIVVDDAMFDDRGTYRLFANAGLAVARWRAPRSGVIIEEGRRAAQGIVRGGTELGFSSPTLSPRDGFEFLEAILDGGLECVVHERDLFVEFEVIRFVRRSGWRVRVRMTRDRINTTDWQTHRHLLLLAPATAVSRPCFARPCDGSPLLNRLPTT